MCDDFCACRSCPECAIMTLGTYDKNPTYTTNANKVSEMRNLGIIAVVVNNRVRSAVVTAMIDPFMIGYARIPPQLYFISDSFWRSSYISICAETKMEIVSSCWPKLCSCVPAHKSEMWIGWIGTHVKCKMLHEHERVSLVHFLVIYALSSW